MIALISLMKKTVSGVEITLRYPLGQMKIFVFKTENIVQSKDILLHIVFLLIQKRFHFWLMNLWRTLLIGLYIIPVAVGRPIRHNNSPQIDKIDHLLIY